MISFLEVENGKLNSLGNTDTFSSFRMWKARFCLLQMRSARRIVQNLNEFYLFRDWLDRNNINHRPLKPCCVLKNTVTSAKVFVVNRFVPELASRMKKSYSTAPLAVIPYFSRVTLRHISWTRTQSSMQKRFYLKRLRMISGGPGSIPGLLFIPSTQLNFIHSRTCVAQPGSRSSWPDLKVTILWASAKDIILFYDRYNVRSSENIWICRNKKYWI